MKRITIILSSLLAFAACSSCTNETNPEYVPKQEEEIIIDKTGFAKGADISWITQMEKEGIKFYTADGKETECTALMKKIGFNSIRLRVWVNPTDGWNSAADVLAKALRAQKEGMRIMIDFHYSDTWADPGNQSTPAAWAAYDIEQLKTAVTEHTESTLALLKDAGVEVEWVQVGNETRNGMMHPLGHYQEKGGKNYAELTNAGYDAVKKIYPDAKVLVHLDGGQNISLYHRIFPVLDKNGGKYDMIGMSLYPCTWNDATASYGEDWKTATDQCIANINTVSQTYGKNVMICEVGMPVSKPELAKAMLSYFLEKTEATGHCEGVFYWEPEAPAGYNNGYQLGAFADGRPTIALDPFKNQNK